MKRRRGNWVPDLDVRHNVRCELPAFAEHYYRMGRKAARKGMRVERLHEFRLITKHFRYLLELFRPLYGPRLDAYLRRLRKVQTVLGDLNDYAVTRQMMLGGPDRDHPDIKRLFAYLDTQHEKKIKEFRRYWKDEFDLPGEEMRIRLYLSRHAGGKRAAPKLRQREASMVK